ncbi:MAG: 2'-5' RNA ligase family protein [Mycobacteriales bacterium]
MTTVPEGAPAPAELPPDAVPATGQIPADVLAEVEAMATMPATDVEAPKLPRVGPTRTIGVAIAIPEPYAAKLQALRHAAGDPDAAIVPPHVTFVPPTEIDESELSAVEEHLAQVAQRHGPFDLHLAGPGTFAPVSRVVFAQVASGISHCEQVEVDIRSGPLERAPVFPYHPHVTVAHDVPQDQLDGAYASLSDFEVRLQVQAFTMFERDESGAWRSRRVFPLDGDTVT